MSWASWVSRLPVELVAEQDRRFRRPWPRADRDALLLSAGQLQRQPVAAITESHRGQVVAGGGLAVRRAGPRWARSQREAWRSSVAVRVGMSWKNWKTMPMVAAAPDGELLFGHLVQAAAVDRPPCRRWARSIARDEG